MLEQCHFSPVSEHFLFRSQTMVNVRVQHFNLYKLPKSNLTNANILCLVRFVSGRNKLVQLLIQSRNSGRQTVRSLVVVAVVTTSVHVFIRVYLHLWLCSVPTLKWRCRWGQQMRRSWVGRLAAGVQRWGQMTVACLLAAHSCTVVMVLRLDLQVTTSSG